jgi:hypothetical protein
MEVPDPTEMGREVAHHLHEQHESRLRRELHEIERDWHEIVVAFILAFAALGSAWCAYQAATWSTRGSDAYAEASALQAEAIEASASGAQMALVDVELYLAWLDAVTAGDTKLVAELRSRFGPELSAAVDDLAATGASGSRAGPFRGESYDVPGSKESVKLRRRATALQQQGHRYDDLGDRFVLIGVVFAVTLFFGAIAGRFKVRALRTAMVVLAAGAFAGALAILLSQPQTIPGS